MNSIEILDKCLLHTHEMMMQEGKKFTWYFEMFDT